MGLDMPESRTRRDSAPAPGHGHDNPINPVDVARSRPVFVGGCFGWLHQPVSQHPTAGGDTAVLLCPGLAWDGLHAYHGTRLLADELAEAGYPALRFQYPGTGNSADIAPGPDGTPDPWAAWLRSAHAAADWLRSTTGARRLILVGLRFGALVAASVAEQRGDVDGLLLLAPVLRGKSYMRQLDMEARLESNAAPDADGGVEFHELRLSAATVARISDVELRRCRFSAPMTIAMLAQAPSQLAESCVQDWRDAGASVHAAGFEGLEPLLQEAIHRDPAPCDFSRLLAWVTQAAPPRAGATPDAPETKPALELAHCTETPVRFGGRGSLFGILCRPKERLDDRVVIIGNTGRDPHYGIARFGTELARRLAGEGVASLRMDFAGLGDSAGPDTAPDRLSALFETERDADVSAAIDALEPLGFRRFAVQGVCSGAYHALRAGQADARIGTLLLVNLPSFEWQGGDSVKAAIWKAAPARRLLSKLTDPSAWMRAARGRADLAGILKAIGHRALAALPPGLGRATPGDTPQRAMAALSRRGVSSLLLYSVGDPGLDALAQAFGLGGEALRAQPGVDLRIVPGIDHVLSGRQMREKAANEMLGFLAAHGPSLRDTERPA